MGLSFHAFFRDCRVEGEAQENSRLLLCVATALILEKGLSILGLKTLNRMQIYAESIKILLRSGVLKMAGKNTLTEGLLN